MRVLVDCQSLQTGSSNRGIGRYVRGMIKGLVELNKDNLDLMLLIDGSRQVSACAIYQEFKSYNVKFLYWYSATLSSLSAFGANNSELNSGLLYEAAVLNSEADILLVGSIFEGNGETFCLPLEKLYRKIKIATICYDFIPFQEVESSSSEYRYWYDRCLNRLHLSSILLCISDFTKTLANLVVPDVPAVNVSGGIDFTIFNSQKDKRVDSQNFINEVGINAPFILYSGGGDKRKNVDLLLQTFIRYCQNELKNFQLVLVMGGHAPAVARFKKLVSSLGLQGRIKILGYIADAQLVFLYRNCFLFVFPSLSEGLGFSVLEAMACGAPVIASNSTSLPEVYGYKDGEFNPTSSDELGSLLIKASQDNNFYQELLRHSKRHVLAFTWQHTASSVLSALNHLCQESKTVKVPFVSVDDIVARAKVRSQSEREYEALAQAIVSQYYKRIYIDITGIVKTKYLTGIQRVVWKISQYIQGLLPDNYEAVFVSLDHGHFCLYDQEGDTWVNKGLINPKPKDVFLCLDLNANLPYMDSFFSQLRERNVSIVTVVYDLVYELYPEVVGGDVALLSKWLQYIVSVSDRILCISRSVKNELENWCRHHGKKTENIDYFYLGCDILSNSSEWLKNKNQDGIRRFVAVSTVEPRKGYDLLLDAFENLFDCYDIELHIVGKKGWKVESLCERIETSRYFNKKLFWHQHATDQELVQILSNSDVYINASIYEGFGLPVVEATQFALPLFLRDISVFRELAGDFASYFKTDQELEELIRTFLKSPESFSPMPMSRVMTWEESVAHLVNKVLTYSA